MRFQDRSWGVGCCRVEKFSFVGKVLVDRPDRDIRGFSDFLDADIAIALAKEHTGSINERLARFESARG